MSLDLDVQTGCTPYCFEAVADLLADTSLNSADVPVGSVIEAGGFRYEVAASGATDQHVTTAGGVKLYALPTSSGAFNVKAFGATGDWQLTTDTGTDDTVAVRAAVDAALSTVSGNTASQNVTNAPYVFFPEGNYMLSSQIDLDYGIKLVGNGQCNIVVRHNGVGFFFPGTQALNQFFSRHRALIEKIRFTRGNIAVGPTNAKPTALFLNGADGAAGQVTYLYSENGIHFSEVVFDVLTCDHVFVNKRGFNIVFDRCYFNSIYCESVISLEQNNGDIPNWSYWISLSNCDFTGILDLADGYGSGTGNGGCAIRSEGGNVWMHGGLIQGCDGNAVELGTSTTYNAIAVAQFSGVYWEANVGHHVKSGPKAVTLTFTSNWFVSSGRGNSFDFQSATNATFVGCGTPNNACTFNTSGNIILERCTYMFGSKAINVNLHTPNYRFETIGTGTLDFAKQLLVPAGGSTPAGGHYLVTLSHYDFAQGGAGGVTVELFSIRVNAGGTGFTATSVSRTVGGTNTVTFTWAYNATDQCLTVTPVTVAGGAANGFSGQVITHNNAVLLPV